MKVLKDADAVKPSAFVGMNDKYQSIEINWTCLSEDEEEEAKVDIPNKNKQLNMMRQTI